MRSGNHHKGEEQQQPQLSDSKQQVNEVGNQRKQKVAKRKAVVQYTDSSDDEQEILFQELAKINHAEQQAKKAAAEAAAKKEKGTASSTNGASTSSTVCSLGKTTGLVGMMPTIGKAKKTKSANIFQPEVGQVVRARWMAGKKDQVPRNGGRGLVGKWFAAVVMEVDHVKQLATVQYKADRLVETEVLYTNIKMP